MENLSLYIHIPFCNSKCNYCDFVSFQGCRDKVDIYVEALIKEINIYRKKIEGYMIDSIFIGGGTPSSISELYIERILKAIFNSYNIRDDCEITIEINPGTLDNNKAKKYRELGINRISIGLQSTDNSILSLLGRTHTIKDFDNSIKILGDNGFSNINVDLIFGVPNQKLLDLERDLNYLIDLKISHIAMYGLIVEEGTRLYDQYMNNEIILPDEDLERKLYHRGVEILKSAGYIHYEISNFSRPGFKSKHNLKYWELKPYLGLGLNSHSYFEGGRFFNTDKLDEYILAIKREKLPIEDYQIQDIKMDISDFCIFGLRLIDGINIHSFEKRFGENIYYFFKDTIYKHRDTGLLEVDGDYIRLSQRGLDLANIVEVDFLL